MDGHGHLNSLYFHIEAASLRVSSEREKETFKHPICENKSIYRINHSDKLKLSFVSSLHFSMFVFYPLDCGLHSVLLELCA